MRPFTLLPALSACLAGALSLSAQAFCGFYVGKADSTLFNEASQVIVARDEHRLGRRLEGTRRIRDAAARATVAGQATVAEGARVAPRWATLVRITRSRSTPRRATRPPSRRMPPCGPTPSRWRRAARAAPSMLAAANPT